MNKAFATTRLAAAALMAFGISSQALAYVPPSSFLIKTIASRRAAPKGVRARTVVTGIEADQPTSAYFKVTTIVLASKRILRSFALDDSGQQLYVHERKLGDESGELSPGAVSAEILFDSDPERVTEVLRRAGVPVTRPVPPAPAVSPTPGARPAATPTAETSQAETMFLSRWKKTVAWVIGPRRDFQSQLWIEKDTFLPVRWIWNGSDAHELQFESYRFTSEFPYPRATQYVEGGKVVFKEELTDVSVNPTADIKALQNPVTPGFTEAGNNAPGTVRDLIRRYFEVAR